jgi:hypothetical protein
MSRTVSRPHTDRDVRAEGFEVFTRPQRSWPARLVGLTIRLRAEITIVALAVLGWRLLNTHLPVWLAVLLLALLGVGTAAHPWPRRYLVRRAFAVLTRHRLRAVFVQRRILNWTGNLPILLWSRPTPIGERVWLLLRAGIDTTDIERNLAHVASGCHAREARVTPHRAITSLATVDVIRRDPLTRRTASIGEPVVPPARPALRAVPDQKGA